VVAGPELEDIEFVKPLLLGAEWPPDREEGRGGCELARVTTRRKQFPTDEISDLDRGKTHFNGAPSAFRCSFRHSRKDPRAAPSSAPSDSSIFIERENV